MTRLRERFSQVEVLIREAKLTEAQQELKKLLRVLGAEDSLERIQLAELLRRIGQPSLGLSALKPLRDSRTEWPAARLAWSGCLMDLGAAGAAITVLESDSNHDWKVQKQMGFARIAQRRYSEAQTHLDKALLLDPGDSYQALILRLNRANCLLQQEQFGLFAQESDALKAPLVRYPMLEEWLLLLNAESSCL